jgi:hypothetical protein
MRIKTITAIIFLVFSMHPAMGQGTIHSITASKLSSILKIASDKNDNLYLQGLFSGTMTLGKKTFNSAQGDSFLYKTDPSYQIIWAMQTQFRVLDMKVKNDHLFVLGQYKSRLSFQGIEKSCKSYNFFFACLNQDGGLEWLADGRSNGAVYGNQFDMDGEGNAYVLCTFREAVTLEDKQVKTGGSKNAFLAKYNRQGKLQWVRHLTGGNSLITGVWPHAVCYDAKNNQILVGGEMAGSCTFDAVKIQTRKLVYDEGETLDGREAFIARYSADGVCSSVKSMATEANLEKILTDGEGNIYFGGHFTGDVTDSKTAKTAGISIFGKDQMVKTTFDPRLMGPSEDGYIVKFDAHDNFQWIARCQGSSTDRIVDFVMDTDGTIYACGFAHVEAGFSGPAKNVAIVPVQGTGEELYKGDLFAVKINQSGDPAWFKMGGGKGTDKADSICLTSHEVKIAGSMSGLVSYDNQSLLVPGTYFNGIILSSPK